LNTMKLKKALAEFIIKHDLVPTRSRWKQTVSAVGSLYRNVFNLLNPSERANLTKMMENWGYSNSEEIIKELGIERDLHGCAVALLAFHRIFGIKSSIVKETEDKIIIHATKCMWKDKKGWGPEICASIDRYEAGLVKGISSDISHSYSKRRSRGDEVCEMVLKKKENLF